MNTSALYADTRPAIHVTEADFDRLAELIDGLHSPSPGASLLAEELDRAVVVSPRYRGQAFARLGSLVEYEDVDTGHRRRVRITLPKDARVEEDSISILSPAGAALLGLKVGQSIRWEVRDGRTQTVKVLAIQD
jgi:regulator of nucleoside diphosphate kinase